MQYDLFPDQVHLRCIDPLHGKRRFYRLMIQPTLFGDWVLMREWGRIGQAGQLKNDHYRHVGQALDALHSRVRAKQRRGYR